jgi:hypothetical protein
LIIRCVHGSAVQFTSHALSECLPVRCVEVVSIQADNIILERILWIAGAEIGARRIRDMPKTDHCLQEGEEEGGRDKSAGRHLHDAVPSNTSVAIASSTHT